MLTCDHIIKPLEVFKNDAEKATAFAAQDKLVIFGISPTRPETGYGYIKAGKLLAEGVHAVDAFLEKPDRKKAEKLAASNLFVWNSGMFAFNCEFLYDELYRYAGNVIRPFNNLEAPDEKTYIKSKGIRILNNWKGLDTAYSNTEQISFDHAVTEKCIHTVMVKAAFDWIDVGDWDEYSRLLSDNENDDNDVEIYSAGTSGSSFVDSDIPVALAGVEDLIVVIRSGKDGSPPAALIVKRGEAQKVRDIVEQIKKTGRTEIL